MTHICVLPHRVYLFSSAIEVRCQQYLNVISEAIFDVHISLYPIIKKNSSVPFDPMNAVYDYFYIAHAI